MSGPWNFLHGLVGSMSQGAAGNPTRTRLQRNAAEMWRALEQALEQ